jgi:hypothetical protein
MSKLIKDILTENNGESYDIARVAIALVVIFGIPLLIWGSVYHTLHPEHPFDAQGVGIALGSLLAGICAATISIGQKQKTDT